MWSTRTNLIHSLKTHCFGCVKQSYRLRVIFYLRGFCPLDTNSIESLMGRPNRCHKGVWIYYYYYYSLFHVSDMNFHDCFFSLISKHFCHIPRFQKLKLGTLLFTSPRISHLTMGTLVVLWSSSQTIKHHTRSSSLSKEVIKCNSHSFPIIHFHHQSYRSFFQNTHNVHILHPWHLSQ